MSLKQRKTSSNFNNSLVLKEKNHHHENPIWLKLLYKYVPITDWLGNYHWREDLMNDVIGGLTIAIMQVPQGMAYALLANVPAVLGLYVSVFPAYIYSIFGSSRHISIGTSPLTCMLSSVAVTEYGSYADNDNTTEADLLRIGSENPGDTGYTPTEVITAICILVGFWQIGFAIIGFGKLAWIMGEVFMSGYTTATSIHVFTSQIKDIFGLDVPRHSGALKLVYGLSNIFGSFFLCIPSAASMSRSLVQVNVGGRTQLVSIISATLLIFILLFIGPIFEPLPKACLAAIIIVALKGMFLQFWDLPKFWKKSKMDGLYWIGTFVATVLLDIDSGLAVGLIISVFMTYYHGLRYSVAEQGIGSNKDGNDVLGDLEAKKQKTSEKAVQETLNFSRIQGLVIIRLSLYMSFTNYEKILKKMGKILRKNSDTLVVAVILDVTGLKQLDQTAGKRLAAWIKDEKNEMRFINAPNDQVWDMLSSFELDEKHKVENVDALLHARDENGRITQINSISLSIDQD